MAYVQFNRSGGGLGCLVFGILAAVFGYYILAGFFYLLIWAAPALFILALIIDWRAVLDTGKSLAGYIQRNPVTGIVLGALLVVGTGIYSTGLQPLDRLGYWLVQGGFPLLALFVLLRALGYKQLNQFKRTMQEQQQPIEEEYVEFEELESRPKNAPPEPEPPLQQPPTSEKQEPKSGNSYDDIFR